MPKRSSRRSLRGRRGQAMVEYSLMFWLICMVFILGFVGMPTTSFSTADGTTYSSSQGDTIFGLLIESYQVYQDGYYFSLCAPLP